jgi:predicted  nucleic acid-binding Zn-ribbon protein
MTLTFNDRAIGLMEQANELREHISFLKERQKFIKDNFSKLEMDRDGNVHRIGLKIANLQNQIQKLMHKAYELVDNPLDLMKHLTPAI